jgi:sugar phosphate isomerase/epimerase
MMPYAKAVSAKSFDFDAQGEETTIDFHRMLAIVTGAGFHGWIGIEYEGERLGEPEGIAKTKALLTRIRSELPDG